MSRNRSLTVTGWVLCVIAAAVIVVGIVTDTPEKNSTWIYAIAITAAFLGVLCLNAARGRTTKGAPAR